MSARSVGSGRRYRTPRPLVHSARELRLPTGRPLKLAVVSDTHSRPHRAAADLLAAERPDALLHAGDIGDLDVLDHLAELAPVIAVRGNIDAQRQGLADVVDLSLRDEAGLVLTLVLTHIAVRGPRLTKAGLALAQRVDAPLVVCGHSHVPLLAKRDGVAVFNPGSIGPRRFGLPITFGVIEVGAGVTFRHVDCETGLPWRPPRL